MRIRGFAFLGLASLATLALTLPASAGGVWTTGSIVVVQVGDGAAPLSSAATPTFLKEFLPGTFTAGLSLSMPTAAAGANRRFTNNGTATSEGFLKRSVDGNYLTLAGYDAAVGSTNPATTAGVPRVIARVDKNGTIDTTTGLTDTSFAGSNIRSVISTDGIDFWAAGTASAGANGGVRCATLGGSTSSQVSATVTNTRVVNIIDTGSGNQLYVSTMSGAFRGVNTVGSGLSCAAGQTTTLLTGFDPSTSSPQSVYDYFFSDANTLYVADDRSLASGGGLQKWTFSAGSWSLAYTISDSVGIAGLRGLTGVVGGGGTVTLYGTTSESSANRLVEIVDAGVGSPWVTRATAPTNTAFRGVDFSPEPATLALLGLGGLLFGRRRRT